MDRLENRAAAATGTLAKKTGLESSSQAFSVRQRVRLVFERDSKKRKPRSGKRGFQIRLRGVRGGTGATVSLTHVYRAAVSGVFPRKEFGFAVCGRISARVSWFVAGIRHGPHLGTAWLRVLSSFPSGWPSRPLDEALSCGWRINPRRGAGMHRHKEMHGKDGVDTGQGIPVVALGKSASMPYVWLPRRGPSHHDTARSADGPRCQIGATVKWWMFLTH